MPQANAQPLPPRVIQFDGRTIQVPADFTDDEVREVLSQPSSSTTRNGTPAPATSYGSELPPSPGPVQPPKDRPIASGIQGAGRSIVDTVALLPDLADMGANALLAGADFVSQKAGGPDISFRFPLASDELAKKASAAASAVGVPVLDPAKMTEKERFAYNVNRLGGQAALTAGVLAPVAASRAAAGAARLPQVGDAFLRPYEAAPIAVAVGDTIAGGGAGVGLTAAQSAPPQVREKLGGAAGVALDLAGMVGGQVGASTLAGAATRGPSYFKDRAVAGLPAKDIPFDPETKLPVSNSTADSAARFVQANTSDPKEAAETIRNSANDFRNMDSPVPTSGLLSNDPKLLAVERGQRRLAPGEFAEADRHVRDTAVETVQGLQPQNVEPRIATAFVKDFADSRIGAARNTMKETNSALETAETSQRDLASAFRPYEGRQAEASSTLDRTIVEKGLLPSQREKNRRYEAIDPDRSVTRGTGPLAAVADDIEKQLAEVPPALRAEMAPERLIADIKAINASPGQMSFGAMNEMRSGLASSATTARKNGQYKLAENLDRFRAAVSREGEALAAEGSEAGERARSANAYYRDTFAPVWNRGPGDEAVRFRKDFNTDQAARTTSPPTTTAGRFMTTGAGAQEKAEALSRVVSSLPDATDQQAAIGAVRQYVLGDLTRTIGRDGRIDPQSMARWLNGPSGWRDALSPFPSVRGEVEKTLADVSTGETRRNVLAQAVERAAAGVKRTEDDIANSALSLVIGREPTKAARAVLESKDPQMAMREIRGVVGGNEKASKAWERAVTDHLVDRITKVDPAAVSSGERSVDYGKLVKTFDRYRGALSELYVGQPDKMNALQRVQKLLEPLAKANGPASMALPKGGDNADLWKVLEVGLKAHYGVLKGGGVLRTLRIATSIGADEAAETQRLVTRMMFDPDLAVHLLTRPVKDVGSPVWNAKLGKLLRRVEVGREFFDDQT